jgi:hypothetical protein
LAFHFGGKLMQISVTSEFIENIPDARWQEKEPESNWIRKVIYICNQAQSTIQAADKDAIQQFSEIYENFKEVTHLKSSTIESLFAVYDQNWNISPANFNIRKIRENEVLDLCQKILSKTSSS